jgi:putative FmdB family regulatory protein
MDELRPGLLRAAKIHRVGFADADGYRLRCDACGHTFEQFQSIKADAVRRCPKCGKNKVKRLISTGAGLIFKGSGFYITDYRDKSYADQAKAESGAKPSGETKGDSKPAETKSAGPAPKKSDAPKSESKAEKKKKRSED